MRIAIIHVGSPAAGMNAATRAAVAYCLTKGHTPIAIHNGFPGLCRHHADTPVSSVRVLRWEDCEDWVTDGGSDIGTNSGLPSDDLPTTARCFESHAFDALLVIGGLEAHAAIHQLRAARATYPSFRIPMILLPASMANNVPGSEYSLGSDTSLNTLVYFCDVVRQSASSSRRCVFVVEAEGSCPSDTNSSTSTPANNSAYLATAAALTAGAMTVYTPAHPITLTRLSTDISYLRSQFANDHGAPRAGKLIIRDEKTSPQYSTDMVARIIQDEAHGRFEAKGVVPGHFQQGGKVSPIDRIRAFRLAVKCMEFLEGWAGRAVWDGDGEGKGVARIGIRGSRVLVEEIDGEEVESGEKKIWEGLQDVVDFLSGRAG